MNFLLIKVAKVRIPYVARQPTHRRAAVGRFLRDVTDEIHAALRHAPAAGIDAASHHSRAALPTDSSRLATVRHSRLIGCQDMRAALTPHAR